MDEQLSALVELQQRAVADFVQLVRDLAESDAQRPTALPGWSVRDVVAHVAHLEAVLAGEPEGEHEVPEDLPHVRGEMGVYTERGVVARRGRTLAVLAAEIEQSTTRWTSRVALDPPEDLSAPAPGGFGALGWSWRVLLSNRPLDVWVHEHDVRAAVDRGDFADSPVARHVVATFARSFGRIVAKRAAAAPGTVAALRVDQQLLEVVVRVDEEGRASSTTSGEEPDVVLRMDLETYVALSAGRRGSLDAAVGVTGDEDLASRITAAMTITP